MSVTRLLHSHCSGYKEYQTGRTYMARMGDWRENKDVEIPLDGIGGVNIIVKADVHRAGMFKFLQRYQSPVACSKPGMLMQPFGCKA